MHSKKSIKVLRYLVYDQIGAVFLRKRLSILLIMFSLFQGFSHQIEARPQVKKRPLLITGCARSGTAFITAFFRTNGFDVRHENDGLYGTVAWTMTGDANTTPWGLGSNFYSFDHIFHQVRHPLKAIASAGNEPPISWSYIRKFVPEINMNDPKIVKGAKYWYYWNLLAEKKAEWTYRIEDIENQIVEMAGRLAVKLDPLILKTVPTNINTRGYRDVYSWNDLKEALDEDLFSNIVKMTERYGYKIEKFQ